MKLIYVIILVAALWLIQGMIGGTRLLFSLPSYSLLAGVSLLTVFSLRRSRPAVDVPCLVASALFFTYILARASWSPVAYLWWSDFYMVLACLMAYLITALYITHSRLRSFVIGALLLIAVVQAFFGIKQFMGGDNWMPFGFIRADNGRRASGMMISPIHFAGYLEAVGAVGLSMALWSTWKTWLRIVTGYVVVMCYVGVALSGSRGGYLSTAFSLVIFATLSLWALRRVAPHRFRGAALVSLVGLLTFVGVAFVAIQQSSDLGKRLDNLFGNKTGLRDMRFYNWEAALDQFRVSPIVGTGAGTHLYFGRHFRQPQLQADPEHAHSDYLELLAEYGIVGAVGMATFLFFHITNLLRAAARSTESPPDSPFESCRDNRLALQIGALAAIAAYLAHSVVDFNLHIPANALLFAFLFGIAANPQSLAIEPGLPLRAVRAFQLALPALGAWMLAAGTPKLPAEDLTEKTRIAVRNKEYPQAIDLGNRALQLEHRNPFLYFHLGEAYRALANAQRLETLRRPYYQSAVKNYRKGLQLFPQDVNLWIRLGQALDGMREYRDAEGAYLNAIKVDPNLGVIHAYYAAHLHARGRHEDAEKQTKLGHQISSGTPYHEAVSSLAEPEPATSQ